MPRLSLAAVVLLLCIACDFHATTAEPPYPPGGTGSANHRPVVTISGPAIALEGGFVHFSAQGWDADDRDTLSFTWLTGDGRTFTGPTPRQAERDWAYQDDGTYDASVIVRDGRGGSDTASLRVVVSNAPPVISVISSPAQQAVGIPASVRVSFTDPGSLDTHILTIRWADGTSDTVAGHAGVWPPDSVVHTYARPGSYVVQVTLRDDDGGADSATAKYPALVFDPAEHRSVAGYEVFDIGTLGGNAATPLDFNDYGKIVGSSLTASGSTHAFVWDNGLMRDLGTLGQEGSEAQRINNAGLIAGSVWSARNEDCGHASIAATWLNGSGTILDLMPDPYERYPTSAAAINESGDIVWTACGHESDYAWLWRDGGWQRLGGLNHPLGASYGRSINEQGQIVGSSGAVYSGDSPGAIWHAFSWENGAMRDLGLLGFRPCRMYPDRNCGYAFATSINESGQVVGFSTAADGSLHAVRWETAAIRDIWTVPAVPTSSTWRAVINDRGQVAGSANGDGFFWSSGTLRTLGSLGGGSTYVVDMNEAGTVVGTSVTANGEQHAFVWTEARGMVDLGTGPHRFNTAWVVGISFSGDIAGFTAPCESAQTCGYPVQGRAILWRNTQASASR